MVTREEQLDLAHIKTLEENGYQLIHLPMISCRARKLPSPIQEELADADWVFFTSATGFRFFEPHLPKGIQIASIGPKTSQAIRDKGYNLAFEASSHYGHDFVKQWLTLGLEGQRILLPQSSLSHRSLVVNLEKAGQQVHAWVMYDTLTQEVDTTILSGLLQQEGVIWTFASPSAWESFIQQVGRVPDQHKLVVIGSTTATAVERAGYRVSLLPSKPTMDDMVTELMKKDS